jgi:hypothetical protein
MPDDEFIGQANLNKKPKYNLLAIACQIKIWVFYKLIKLVICKLGFANKENFDLTYLH